MNRGNLISTSLCCLLLAGFWVGLLSYRVHCSMLPVGTGIRLRGHHVDVATGGMWVRFPAKATRLVDAGVFTVWWVEDGLFPIGG